MGLIYIATNQINGKFYVGKTTKTLEHRRQGHANMARWNSQTYFHRAIRKYGFNQFKFSVLEICGCEEALSKRERFWIAELKAQKCGYNLTEGGEGSSGRKLSEETKLKISIANTGKSHGPLSDEHKHKISIANKGKVRTDAMKESARKKSVEWHKNNDNPMLGKKHSENSRAIMSQKKKGVFDGEDNPMYGKKHTEGTRKKMSERQKMCASRCKPVKQLTVDGVCVGVFGSGSDASRKTGIDSSSISKCCRDKKLHAGGYRWRYHV